AELAVLSDLTAALSALEDGLAIAATLGLFGDRSSVEPCFGGCPVTGFGGGADLRLGRRREAAAFAGVVEVAETVGVGGNEAGAGGGKDVGGRGGGGPRFG